MGESAELNTMAHRHLVCSRHAHVDPIQDKFKTLTYDYQTLTYDYQTLTYDYQTLTYDYQTLTYNYQTLT